MQTLTQANSQNDFLGSTSQFNVTIMNIANDEFQLFLTYECIVKVKSSNLSKNISFASKIELHIVFYKN